MTDNSLPRVFTRAELETRNLILYIRSRKWRYLLIILLMGAYFFYLFKFKILEYKATATFIVNNKNEIATALGLESLSSTDNFIRIHELVNSIQTQIHLIKKFNLIQHYDIDSTKEFYLQKAIAKIRSKIVVARSPLNTISVTVKDPHRYLTSEMANEIVRHVEKLNHDYYVTIIQQRLNISLAFTNQIEKDNSLKTATIDTLIKKINILISSGKGNEQTNYDLLVQQQRLNEIALSFENSAEELVNTRKMYAMALEALNLQKLPTTTLVQEAMPAFRSLGYTAALYSAGAMIVVFFFLVIQGYFWLSYKHYFILMITGR